MFDFTEYRENAHYYMEAEKICEEKVNSIKDEFDYNVDTTYKTLTVQTSLNTKQMKEIEDNFGVTFGVGGRKYVKFDFNLDQPTEKIRNRDMRAIRAYMDIKKNLFTNYFEDIVRNQLYHHTKIAGELRSIELSRKFWGFTIKGTVDRLTLDEIMAIEEETASDFVNYDITFGYQFHFREEMK